MGSESTRDVVEIVRQRLHECRELLLDASRACIAEAGPDAWEKADALFGLAKQLELFRQRLDQPAGEQQGNSANHFGRLRKVGGKRLGHDSREAKKKKSDYPKYAVEDNALVKYGLCRDRRKEYRHVVPRESFEKVASRVESLSSGGEW